MRRLRSAPNDRHGHPRSGRRITGRPRHLPRRRKGRARDGRSHHRRDSRVHEVARNLTMGRVTIAGLLAHKLRLALTAFAIVLGVSFVSATLTLSNGLQTTFDNIFTNQSTGVAVVVRGHLDASGQNGGFRDAHRPLPRSPLPPLTHASRVSAAE